MVLFLNLNIRFLKYKIIYILNNSVDTLKIDMIKVIEYNVFHVI